MKIETDEQHAEAIEKLSELMDALQEYEKKRWPMKNPQPNDCGSFKSNPDGAELQLEG
jgi:hypothetical protein